MTTHPGVHRRVGAQPQGSPHYLEEGGTIYGQIRSIRSIHMMRTTLMAPNPCPGHLNSAPRWRTRPLNACCNGSPMFGIHALPPVFVRRRSSDLLSRRPDAPRLSPRLCVSLRSFFSCFDVRWRKLHAPTRTPTLTFCHRELRGSPLVSLSWPGTDDGGRRQWYLPPINTWSAALTPHRSICASQVYPLFLRALRHRMGPSGSHART